MKKNAFCIIFLIILLVICSISYADDTYSKPITFRGLTWGSSFDEVINSSNNKELSFHDLRSREYWYPVDSFLYTEDGQSYQAEIGCYTYALSSSLKNLSVAGYPVDELYLYFVYLPGDDGLLIKDSKHTALVYAFYKFEPKDLDAAYEDFVAKLTKLYGDIDYTQQDSFLIADKQSVWNGAEGTKVSVLSRDYSTGSKYLYVKYAFSGADKLIQEAYDAVVLEEKINAADNTDGL